SQPLAYLSGPRLLLQTLAAGPSLYRFLDDLPAGARAVTMTGRWLAKLHNVRLGDGSELLDPVREAARLATFRDALVTACPWAATRVSRLVEQVTTDGTATGPLVPTHGDFQPKNVHVIADRVTVIDFDRFALAEPARDLGHFVAQSMTMSYVRTGSFDAVQAWNRAFLDAYVAEAPPRALAGMAVATVRSMLEILYYKLVVRPVRDASFLGAWLDECDRCLAPDQA
ncbi:MAG: phosphotransferase family protein, partial [Actinomycetes bacterium]